MINFISKRIAKQLILQESSSLVTNSNDFIIDSDSTSHLLQGVNKRVRPMKVTITQSL